MNNSEDHRITVERWQITYLVSPRDPSSDLCRSLDALVKTEVAKACAEALQRGIGAGDRSVWLIRRLDLDLNLAVGRASAESAARRWGVHLAERIHRTLDRGEEDDSVLRFPDRAAYLAQFLRDLARSRAWGRWYYQEFESLRSLSISRTISELFAAGPDQVGPVLARLMAIQGLRDVLSALSALDSRRVFQTWQSGLASMDASSGESVWVGRLLEYWADTPFRDGGSSLSPDNPFRDGLWWGALAAARLPGSELDPGLLAAVDSLLELRGVLSLLSPFRRAAVMRSLATGDIAGAAALALRDGVYGRSDALQFFARNMQGDLNWAVQAEGVLLGERAYLAATGAPQVMVRGPAIPSACAGVFRLGPSFLAGGCREILEVCDPAFSTLLRHLCAMKCMGGERASSAADDPALRLFSGFQRGNVTGALEALDPGQVDLPAVQAVFANTMLSSGRCQGACWLAEVVSLPRSGRLATLWRDVLHDEWVFGTLLPHPPGVRAAEETLAQASATAGTESPVFLWRAGDSAFLPPPGHQPWISLDRESGVVEQLAGKFQVPLSRFSRALRPAAADLAYFSLPETFPRIAPEFELTWTLLARAILRHFTRRLIGFDRSSPSYIYQNFLSGAGFVRDTGDRIEVELQGSELSIVLRLSGLFQETYVLPWIEGREICLLPPGE